MSTSLTTSAGNRVVTKRRRRWCDSLAPYLFIFPFAVFFLALFLGPTIYALALSFFRYSCFGSATWVGLTNYQVMLGYNVFWAEMFNVLFYWLAHAIPMFVFAFMLALLVHSEAVKHKRFFKPMIFVPQVVASAASALLFQNFFGTNYGILNHLMGTQIPWLTDPNTSKWAVVTVMIWRSTGYWFVILLAGLTSISTEVIEAAKVDGANAWQRMTRVTIPLMRNTFLFCFVVDAIVTVRLFAEPNILAGKPGTLASVDMAPVLNLVVENIRSGQFGLAAAVGWLMFVVIAAVSWLQFRIFRENARD